MGGFIYKGEGRGHGRVGVNKVGLGTRRKCTVEVKGRLLLRPAAVRASKQVSPTVCEQLRARGAETSVPVELRGGWGRVLNTPLTGPIPNHGNWTPQELNRRGKCTVPNTTQIGVNFQLEGVKTV